MAAPNMHLVAPAFGHLAASDAESFGSAVWLWMQAAKLHDRPLCALDRMLLPAIQLGQFLSLTAIASTVFAQGAEQSNFVGPAFAFAPAPSIELRAEYEAITY